MARDDEEVLQRSFQLVRLVQLYSPEVVTRVGVQDIYARSHALESFVQSSAPSGASLQPPPDYNTVIPTASLTGIQGNTGIGSISQSAFNPEPAAIGKRAQPRYVNVCLAKSMAEGNVLAGNVDLQVKRPYFLRMDVGKLSRDSVVTNAAEQPFPRDLLPQTERGHWLEIIVASDEFEVKLTRSYLFLPTTGQSWVCDCPPDGDHTCSPDTRKPYLFVPILSPAEPSSAYLRLGLYFSKNLVQSQIMSATISPEEHIGRGYSSKIDYTLTANLTDIGLLPPRDIHILTNHNYDGTYRVVINSEIQPLIFDLTEGQVRSAINTARQVLRDTHFIYHQKTPLNKEWYENLLDNDNAKSRESFPADLERLATAGTDLWDILLRDREAVWQTLDTPANIQVSSIENGMGVFPWALVYDIPLDSNAAGKYKVCSVIDHWQELNPRTALDRACPRQAEHERKNFLCPFAFWGVKHLIEEPQSTKNRAFAQAISIVNHPPKMVVAMTRTLDPTLTQKHITNLAAALAPDSVTPLSSLADIVPALAGSIELVYFYCHGKIDQVATPPGTPPRSKLYLEVGDNDRIEPKDITNWRRTGEWTSQHWQDTSPLVFINGCHTVEFTPDSLGDFVSSFISANAGGVIGTEITMLQSVANEAAEQFFHSFSRSAITVGEALWNMRVHFLEKNNLLGLAYTPYCSASLILRS